MLRKVRHVSMYPACNGSLGHLIRRRVEPRYPFCLPLILCFVHVKAISTYRHLNTFLNHFLTLFLLLM
jgi:hypothetical protein